MANSESVDYSFILSTSFIFFPWPSIWFDFFEFVVLLIPLCSVSHVRHHFYMKTGLDRGMLSFLFAVLMFFFGFFCLQFRFLDYLRVQVSSGVQLFFLICVGSVWCASVFVLVG